MYTERCNTNSQACNTYKQATPATQNRNWLWGENKLETTKMDNQSDGKK